MSAPLINNAIGSQNFEQVRDQIGGILLAEFDNQHTAYGLGESLTPTTIDVERFISIEEGDFPVVTVRCVDADYSNKDYSGNVTGDYCYYIDIYTGSASTSSEDGDQQATLNLQRMIGIVRAILDNPIYKTLGFDPGFGIQNVGVKSFFISKPKNTGDAIDYICGRLEFWVKVPETVPLISPIPVGSISIKAKLYNSDNYYFWFMGSGVVDIPQNVGTVYRSLELFIKTTPDLTKTIPVGNGLFVQQEYAPCDVLIPVVSGTSTPYLAGMLIYRPLFLNDGAISLFQWDIATGSWDRTNYGGFLDQTENEGSPDCVIINFRDYE